MDLMDLGLEYIERAVHLKQRAKKISVQLSSQSETGQRELRRRMAILNYDANECTRIGRLLINYYRRELKNEPNKL